MDTKSKLLQITILCGLALVVLGWSLVPVTAAGSTFSDANWITMGGIPGADGTVHAAAVDGSGNLYIGGRFTVVGDVIANNIAKWDGTNWSALGSGMDWEVYALAVSGSDLYAGGGFTTAGGSEAYFIAKWDGTTWSALGAGMDSPVNALVVSGSNLYAGGNFFTAGGSVVNSIAKWNGSSWSTLGEGMDNSVRALAISGSDLYAGGLFTMATNTGGVAVTANSVAKWNGTNWSALGLGIGGADSPSFVNALAVSSSDVYVGGVFTTATNSDGVEIAANYVAKWNGSSWSALDSGVDRSVLALAAAGNDLYAGGVFRTTGGSEANSIAKWNGSKWSALGEGMSGGDGFNEPAVIALVVAGINVYAGGNFSTAGGSAANNIAKWDGSIWSALGAGSGMGGGDQYHARVRALTVSGSDVYVGGSFITAGGTLANSVAKWNGSNWSALGLGVHVDAFFATHVSALAISGNDLFAAGRFLWATNSDGLAVTVNHIAKWDGTNWSALGSGINTVGYCCPSASALAVSGSNLYVGGQFNTAGGIAATNIAKWDGSSWSALGSGIGGDIIPRVYALAVSGSDLYAGGRFTTAGGSAANFIAKWNGSSWSTLGSGMDSIVYALAVLGSDLYAGGFFTRAGGSAANNIAKWNGSSWSALGSGIGGSVSALAVSGSDLYAGGLFTAAGGSAAANIANWNGSSWTALGSGMGGFGGDTFVSALAVLGSDLYAGGQFTIAGGKVSAYIARAYLLDLPALSVRRSGIDVKVFWPSADTTDFALEQAGSPNAPGSWVANVGSVTDDGTNKSVTLPATNSPQFFRLRKP